MKQMQLKIKNFKKLIIFFSNIFFAFLLTYLLRGEDFNLNQNYVMFILLVSIGLWVTESVPPFSVGILIIGFLVFTMSQTPNTNFKKYLDTWSDYIIWLFLGGFFLAEGIKKTKLDELLLITIIKKIGNNPCNILLGIMIITMILSSLMSNTATTSMILASISPLLIKLGKQSNLSKALLLGVPASASIGGMGTIIGSAPNAIAIVALKNMGYDISFFGWMIIGFPVAFFLTYIFYFYLIKNYQIKKNQININVNFIKKSNLLSIKDKIQRIMVVIILIITLLLWLTSKISHIPVVAISGVPIILFSLLGVIEDKDIRKLPWDILMIISGGLALGIAVEEQGIAQYFVEKIKNFHFNYYILLIVFAFITIIFSNFMSNTAASTILIPIAATFLSFISNEIDQKIFPIVISLCASCSLLLPVSTPPNAIAYSYGVLKLKDFFKGGILMMFIAPIIIISWCLLYSIFCDLN